MRSTSVEDGVAAEPDPARLLDEYRRGDFFLSSARRVLLASGVAASVEDSDITAFNDRVEAMLAGQPGSIGVGVLPFNTGPDARHPGRVVVPRGIRIADSLPPEPPPAGVPGNPLHVEPVPTPEAHRRAVAEAVSRARAGALRKVVLARALDVRFAGAVDSGVLLCNLVRDNPNAYTFAAELPHRDGRARALVGSSPELLVSRIGRRLVSHPLAGSAPRSADPIVDRENARALQDSVKDHAEHAMLTEAVVEALRPLCGTLDVPRHPVLTPTSTMWHLGTTISGELADPAVTSLRVASALHPTPAVCGTPTNTARALVDELEPFDRAYYAGSVGWMDGKGDGEWLLAIRCAEITDDMLRLYAGGGITAHSGPQEELDETTAKFRTLLRAVSFADDL